jgi:hypothetical protein
MEIYSENIKILAIKCMVLFKIYWLGNRQLFLTTKRTFSKIPIQEQISNYSKKRWEK